MEIIIDAYNLIFQCGWEGRHRTPANIRRARARLLETLVVLLPRQQCNLTTVVFDAKRLPPEERHADSRRSGIRVLYAVGYEDADSMIEELIAEHSHPKKLLVVSSDHRIQTAATRRKATAIDSEVWLDRLEREATRSKHLERTPLERSQPAGDQLDESDPEGHATLKGHDWRREFGLEASQDTDGLLDEIHQEIESAEAPVGNPDQVDLESVEELFKDVDWVKEFELEDDE